MPRARLIQQRFTQGELDPKMLGRKDIDQYYGAAETARNIFTLPQGGFKRRPGLEHIDYILGGSLTKLAGGTITETAPNGGTAANGSDQNSGTSVTTTTNISTTSGYVVLHYDLGSAKAIGVLYLYALALTVSGTSDEFFLQVSTDNAAWTTVGEALEISTTAKDFSRRVHGSYRYVRLVRIGTTDLTTNKATLTGLDVATESGLSNVRLIGFVFNVEQTYLMVMTDKNIAIYQNGVYQIDVYASDYTSARLADLDWVQQADSLILYHEDVQTQQLLRNGGNDIWLLGNVSFTNIPTYDYGGISYGAITMTPTAAGVGSTTFTASSAIFTAAMVGWVIRSFDRHGYARITAYTSTTVVTATIIDAFDSTTASTDWQLEEPVWSATRGWPRHGAFYQGRLYQDGGKSRPRVGYGSFVNQPFNYDFGTGLDDEAVGPFGADEFDPILNFYPGRNLMVFTSAAEYIIPQPFGDPITPSNISIARQSSIGSEPNLRPQETEGGVLYVQRGGKSIQEFLFDNAQQAYGNNLVSLLSSHLVTGPTDFALRKATSNEEGAYLLLTRDDGDLTVANILRQQGIASFTPQDTDGEFKACGVDIDVMYFAVQRTINGVTRLWLEAFNDDHYLDASARITTGLPQDVFSDLAHLEAEVCRVRADDSVLDNVTVSSGSVTIERDAEDYVEIGLNFTPLFKDLAPELPQVGSILGLKVNLSEIILQLYQTSGIVVNGKTVSFRGFGPSGSGSPLDSPPPEFTGTRRFMGWSGWNGTGQVEITQNDPQPMTVLAIAKRINV